MNNGNNRSICGSCKNKVDCAYLKTDTSRLFCEEFEIDMASSPDMASNQKNCNESVPNYGNLAGLCMNCENVPVCVYSKPDFKKSYCLEYA